MRRASCSSAAEPAALLRPAAASTKAKAPLVREQRTPARRIRIVEHDDEEDEDMVEPAPGAALAFKRGFLLVSPPQPPGLGASKESSGSGRAVLRGNA